MNTDKRTTFLLALSLSLASAALTALLLSGYYGQRQFQTLGRFCGEILAARPDSKQTVLEALKAEKSSAKLPANKNILRSFGYKPSDFMKINADVFGAAGAGLLAGGATLLLAFFHWTKKTKDRIQMLTEYLEKINAGEPGLLFDASEDAFSRLQDEIYKTVTTLYQTRDAALKAKENFADNLSNIAHQLKTPIAALFLSCQMMREEAIKRQLKRLAYLEEALLLLSRIDAGTLPLKRASADVFTILTLASDNLQELFSQAGVFSDIPEMGELRIDADLDWTMEAVTNLLKNCAEHAPKGTAVHGSYGGNPLYAAIRIWDEGRGFAKEDLPHLFRRFYRGKNAKDDGVGIGLALAKAIIEMQNGTIRAFNLPTGGACFEIRFYRH